MATCNECIHYDACLSIYRKFTKDTTIYTFKGCCELYKPTADVVEVKHGEWIKKGNEKKCTVCEFIYYSNNDEWNYCPNCGAKMDRAVNHKRRKIPH